MKKRKYYKIEGKLNDREWELIDEAENFEDALYLLGEYRIAFGRDWRLRIRNFNDVIC